jgi:hypothetical protein
LDVSAGSTYEVPKDIFHDTTVLGDGLAVTLIKKSNVEDRDPVLLIPFGTDIPKDTFMRDQIKQDFAWNKIRELLKMIAV